MRNKIEIYIKAWKQKGYSEDIPDDIPNRLMELNLAPSYKAIALAILKNDHSLKDLGFAPQKTQSYHILKKIEIAARNSGEPKQLKFNF